MSYLLLSSKGGRTRRVRPLTTDPSFAVLAEGTFRVSDVAGSPYTLELTITNENSIPECTRVVIVRADGEPPITTEGIRLIRLRELVDDCSRRLVFQIDPDTGGLGPIDEHDQMLRLDRAISGEKETARRRITDEDLRKVADAWHRAKALGHRTGAYVEVNCGLTPDQARKYIRKARDAGLIPPVKEES